MQTSLPKCIYVPATFKWNDVVIKNVGVRFKGNSSSNPRQRHKRSYLIKFGKYDKEQKFIGLQRASFDNGIQFGSLFSETVISEILGDLGLKTYRCNYARLFVNDKYAGVYVNVERIDPTFVRRQFPGSTGGLWKNDIGGPGGKLDFVGEDPARYAKAFEAKNGVAEKNLPQVVQFIKQINGTNPVEFEKRIESLIDLDGFLKTTAVMLLSGAFDQLTGWGPHNYYLYFDNQKNQWHYLPWDLDVGFCEVAFGRVFVIQDWHAAWPVPAGHRNILLDRIIANPRLLARYRAIAKEVLEKYFTPDRLTQAIDKKYALIKDHLKDDPFPKVRATVPTDKNYDQIVESLKSFVRKRYQAAKGQLADPGQRPTKPTRAKSLAGGNVPAEIKSKMEQVMKLAKQKQRTLQELDRIFKQIGPLMQRQQFDDVLKLLNRAEKLAKQ